MDKITQSSGAKRNIWMRGLFMLLMGLAFHVSGTVLGIVTVIQFVIVLMSDSPNERLLSFGRSLGVYLRQIVSYLTFVTQDVPFPFQEWPSAES
jgi:hypothetical protein